jgi:carboxynorspermidine decarboxylase
MNYTFNSVPTPCYVLEEKKLKQNLAVLDSVQKRTGCRIILALKGFAMFCVFPQIKKVLHGTTASSLDEARLGFEEFGKEVHLCAPAYRDRDIPELVRYCNHIVFNSFSQWERHKKAIQSAPREIICGIRINPEHSEVKVAIYDPCGPRSRLGVTLEEFRDKDLSGISGLHFHTLCELNADSLKRTLAVVERKFGPYLEKMQWVNFGGGHHITRPDYDVDGLCDIINDFKSRYDVNVYLEPGEAIALNTGVFVSSVLDIIHNQMDIAILDCSAATHMPDVLEMPYRPEIENAGKPEQFPYTCRLAGLSCLAGDMIGDYSFPEPLQVGSRLIFEDMAHYTMVKNNTFNGVRLPSIGTCDELGSIRIVKEFGYEDYRNRLS